MTTPSKFGRRGSRARRVYHDGRVSAGSHPPGGLNALKSAAKEPSVTRFVYTSSSIAATLAKPNVALAINETT